MRNDFKTSSLNENEVQPFLYKIENDEYYIRGIFLNPNGDRLEITKQSLFSLNFNDSIYEPFIDGVITILNKEDSLERTVEGKSKTIKGFNYRGDGKDVFYIEIVPIQDTGKKSGVLGDENLKYNRVFSLQNLFACVDEETIYINGVQYKRIKLMDLDKKRLTEKKIQFNSAEVISDENSKKQDIYKDNNERAAETGTSIKTILTKTLQKNEEELFHKEKSGAFDFLGKRGPTNFDTGLSRIFYSSDAENYAYDDLMYLYKHHVSNGDRRTFCYLKKEYFGGKYTFESIENIFRKAIIEGQAGNYFIEKLKISSGTSVSDQTNSTPVATVGAASFANKSNIIDCKFFNQSFSLTKDSYNTKIVHSYDHENKQFKLFKRDAAIKNVRDKFNEIFVAPLGEQFPAILTNVDLQENQNFEEIYSLYSDETIARSVGLNQLLRSMLATSISVELTCYGQMFRKAGRFISIDRSSNYTKNDFDSKFLGTYFILKVIHDFAGDNAYINKIYAVKTYFNDKILNEEGLN